MESVTKNRSGDYGIKDKRAQSLSSKCTRIPVMGRCVELSYFPVSGILLY